MFDAVFSPFKVKDVEIRNRIVFQASIPLNASGDGNVTREMITYYRRIARGGAGVVVIGDSAVDFEYARDHARQLNLGRDEVIAGLSELVEEIHRQGALASIEVNHAGRMASPRFIGRNPIGPSPIPAKMEQEWIKMFGRKIDYRVDQMTIDQIHDVEERFAEAAFRCRFSGMRAIMLHGAHGHLLGQFVSPYTNKRNDQYGGSLENRARFVIETLDAIRSRVRNGLILQYRISADELVPEGMRLQDTIDFVKMIEDRIDVLHISAGLITDPETVGRGWLPTYAPKGINVHYAEKIREKTNIPLSVVGNIDIPLADRIIREGIVDLVDMVRPLIADTDYVNKYRSGRGEEARPCIKCNMCSFRVATLRPIRCSVDPTIGREMEFPDGTIPLADTKRKLVVIGGGPGGMEAALIAAARGHHVVLYEREKELGGQLIYAAAEPMKPEMGEYLRWFRRTLERQSNVDLVLSKEATPDLVRSEEPDAVVVAVGSEPAVPNLPGIDLSNVHSFSDVLLRRAEVEGKVVIAGAGATGLETALMLAQEGRAVTVIDKLTIDEIAPELAAHANKPRLLELLRQHEVEIITEHLIERITEQGVVVIDRSGNRKTIGADSVVLALGMKPRKDVADAFKGTAPEVYSIGDCVKPGTVMDAVHQAFNIAVNLRNT